jgi:hypothetical protein
LLALKTGVKRASKVKNLLTLHTCNELVANIDAVAPMLAENLHVIDDILAHAENTALVCPTPPKVVMSVL